MNENLAKRKKFDTHNVPVNLKYSSKKDVINPNSPINANKKSVNSYEEVKSKSNLGRLKDLSQEENKINKDHFNDHIVKEDFIIAKIDTIYSCILETEPYYYNFPSHSRLCFVFVIVLVNILTYTMKKPVNNVYCWDKNFGNFVVCNVDYNCNRLKNGQHKAIFIDKSSNLTNEDPLIELEKINEAYSAYFLLEQNIFISNNNNNDESGSKIIEFFNVKIHVDQNEKWYFVNTFRESCQQDHNLLVKAAFIFLGVASTPLFYGLLSDIFGRKPLLIYLLIMIGLGCYGSYLYHHFVTGLEKKFHDQNLEKYIEFANNTIFKTYADNSDKVFSTPIYSNKFAEINLKIDSQTQVREFHSKYKAILYVFYIMIISSFSAFPTGLSLTLENALSENQLHDHYFRYFLAVPLGYFIFTLLLLIQEIKWAFLIMGILISLYIIFVIFKVYESPRFLFEYRDYKSLTNVLEKTITKHSYLNDEENKTKNTVNPLEKFYTYSNQKANLFKTELQLYKEFKNDSILDAIVKKGCLNSSKKKMMKILRIIKEKKFLVFKKSELIQNLTVLLVVMFNSKNLKSKFKILCASMMIISFLYYGLFFNLFTPDFIARNDLKKVVYNHSFTYAAIVQFVSFSIFSTMMKFFNFSIVLSSNFVGILIFSIILGFNNLRLPTYEDLNTEYFSSLESEVRSQGLFNASMKLIIMFFSSGQFYCLYYILVKNTKTLYRATFMNLSYFIITVIMFFAFVLVQYFNKSILYLAIVSIFGLVNLLFLDDPNENGIISDFTDLEI